jgi:4-amino-4-deoxy-L-arabinose transferase-like glycosyltransferase
LTRPEDAPRWWAEWQLWLVLAVVALAILPRIDAVPFRGEEHRRVQVAEEMAARGDWVVPREQGQVFLSRPPLQQWVLAVSSRVFPGNDRLAARFPSALAVILTSILLYGYSRQFVGRCGAVVAAIAYPTAGEVLGQSQQAETEALFVFLMSSALLLWHWGYSRNWSATTTWALGYGFAAAAGLCKGGLQPPVYLLGPIGMYLLWKRDLRYTLSLGHLAGLFFGLALIAAWAFPCAARVGWILTKYVWMADTSSRFMDWQLGPVLGHLARFPAEVFGCLLPWSILVPAAFVPAVRRALAGNDAVAFCGIVLLVAFPTCWIPPGGQTRYFAAVYPCFAVLVGALADRAAAVEIAGVMWRRYMLGVSVLVAIVAVAGVAGTWVLHGTSLERVTLPAGHALVYAVILVGFTLAIARLRQALSPGGIIAGAVAVALACGVLHTGVLTDARVNYTNDVELAVAPVNARLSADATMVGIGEVHAAVRYHLHREVPRPLPWEKPVVPPGAYFCFNMYHGARPVLPFEWDEIGVVSVDRFRDRKPECEVLVGRRRN